VGNTGLDFEVSAPGFTGHPSPHLCLALVIFLPLPPRTYAAASLSQVVKDAQACEEDENASPEDVELIKVESACLEKVVDFLKHHEIEPMNEITTPLSGNTFDGVVTQEWYRDFIKGLDQSMLFDLVTAANFMAIREWNPPMWDFRFRLAFFMYL